MIIIKAFGNIQRYTPITLHPKAPLYNIIIIVHTILSQKQNFKREKQLSQQYHHIASLACTTKAQHTSTVRNVKITIFEKIVLLLHPHVDVPYSLVVT